MQDIESWLSSISLEQYAKVFRDNDIGIDLLEEVTEQDLRDMGLSIGHRRRLLAAVRKKQAQPAVTESQEGQDNADIVSDSPEHRQLTVLFCDLAESTQLSQKLNSEDLREVTLAYQGACKEVIDQYQGYIARYMGDGLLVYFGYPQAHEDDAQLAVHAGLGIVKATQEVSESLGSKKGVSLGVRVGIATGAVIVGDLIGAGASRESAVVGETPNLAARLQGLASLNSVVISATTHRLTSHHFETISQGLRSVKGFSELVESWNVFHAISTADHIESRSMEFIAPLVGRVEESEILLRRWERSKTSRGQVVFLSGEPGIGKSRLIRFLRDNTDQNTHIRLRYQCSQHHTNSPLYPFIQQFEFAANFVHDDTDEDKLDKLSHMTTQMGDSDETHIALLASLLALPLSDRHQPYIGDSRLQRKDTHAMFETQLEMLASKAPVLIAFEDLHWADPSSLELLDRIVECIRDMPVMLVLTFRPDFTCPWTGLPHATLLALNRMDEENILAIVANVTDGEGFDKALLNHIVSRTDGIPLFVEEMSKMLMEARREAQSPASGVTEPQNLSVRPPETLRDSLTARLDRLGSAKSIAQVSAVIGRQVEYQLLEKVVETSSEQLIITMDMLVSAGLMSCRGSPPHATYTFQHALIQDTAYQSMLSNKRIVIHSRIADAIQEFFEEDTERRPELIAHHYKLAEKPLLALDHYEKAASRTLSRSNYIEGIHYLNEALSILDGEPESPQRDERELGVQTAMGGAMIATKGFASKETGGTYTRAADLYKRIGGDTTRFNPVRYGVFVVHLVRSEFDVAYDLAQEFVTIADRQENSTEHLVAYRILGTCQTFMGKWEQAVPNLEKAISLYDASIHHGLAVTYAQDPRIAALALNSWALLHLGRFDEAIASAETAVAEAHKFKHLHTTAYTLGLGGTMFHQFCGDLEKTRKGADTLVDLCSIQPVPLWTNLALCLQGWAIGMAGDFEAGIRQMQAGYNGFASTGARLFMPYYNALIAQLHVEGGQHKLAIEALDQSARLLAVNSEGWFMADYHRINGDLNRAMDFTAKAEIAYNSGLELAKSTNDLLNQLRCTMGLAELAKTTKDREATEFQLKTLTANIEQGGHSIDILRANKLLSTI